MKQIRRLLSILSEDSISSDEFRKIGNGKNGYIPIFAVKYPIDGSNFQEINVTEAHKKALPFFEKDTLMRRIVFHVYPDISPKDLIGKISNFRKGFDEYIYLNEPYKIIGNEECVALGSDFANTIKTNIEFHNQFKIIEYGRKIKYKLLTNLYFAYNMNLDKTMFTIVIEKNHMPLLRTQILTGIDTDSIYTKGMKLLVNREFYNKGLGFDDALYSVYKNVELMCIMNSIPMEVCDDIDSFIFNMPNIPKFKNPQQMKNFLMDFKSKFIKKHNSSLFHELENSHKGSIASIK